MNLEQFRAHIRSVDHSTLDAYHDELSGKKRRARDPQRRLGYALALDMLCEESQMRRPIPPGRLFRCSRRAASWSALSPSPSTIRPRRNWSACPPIPSRRLA